MTDFAMILGLGIAALLFGCCMGELLLGFKGHRRKRRYRRSKW